MDNCKILNEQYLERLENENKELKENLEWMAKRIIKLEGAAAQARLSERTFDKHLGWKGVH